MSYRREDKSSLFREQIARGKAMGALGLGMDSAKLAKVAEARPAFINAAFAASEGRIIPVPGGVLVRNGAGAVIGAVGISGDVSEADDVVRNRRHQGCRPGLRSSHRRSLALPQGSSVEDRFLGRRVPPLFNRFSFFKKKKYQVVWYARCVF